jgi:hypothetical protein
MLTSEQFIAQWHSYRPGQRLPLELSGVKADIITCPASGQKA